MNRICTGLAVVSLGLACGCAVGPDYKVPETATPPEWSSPAEGGLKVAPADLSQWWTAFGDPTLDSLIERSVKANLTLREAEARVREARAQRGVVAAELWPQVDVAAAYARNRFSQNAFNQGLNGGGGQFAGNPEGNLYSAGFDAAWELDVFGRVRRGVEAADADIGAAQEARSGALVSLLAEVARNYVDLRSFQGRLDIANGNVVVQQDSLSIARARYEAGLTSELDVARAESQLAATQSQIPVFETGLKQAVHRLSVLMAQPPGALLAELSQSAPIPKTPSEIAVGIPGDLVRRRPDIRRAERELAAATALVGAATADLFPRFSITGSFGYESQNWNNFTDSTSRFWSIGPAVRWPIFDAGRIRSNIHVQDAKTEQALDRYEQSVLTAMEEVENAMVAFAREQVRRRSLSEAALADERAVDLANQLYTRGLTDYLNVLDSQRSLFILQDQLAESDALVASNLIALYKALGGGWEGPPEPAREGAALLGEPR